MLYRQHYENEQSLFWVSSLNNEAKITYLLPEELKYILLLEILPIILLKCKFQWFQRKKLLKVLKAFWS